MAVTRREQLGVTFRAERDTYLASSVVQVLSPPSTEKVSISISGRRIGRRAFLFSAAGCCEFLCNAWKTKSGAVKTS